CARGGQDFDYW
nr:immunoglobulin heavy chain junction region [Macaca mulatta]MOW98137.1 immunoglobulin heavy chain junction region [Macaca mulatta]MOW98260.1 immunoglobulin heavy chain junction region [Macaca mulatta]MOW98316.1 immunoglobulin heavy chain junction region [Macaca mulatta]MOW98351.1 immunoglobulin heavy chain junction region [Macaca mulatta]